MNFKGGNRLLFEKIKIQNNRYHRQRLTEIRNAKFRDSKSIPKLDDRKGQLHQEERKEQIQKENAMLSLKINKILDKKNDITIRKDSKPKQLFKSTKAKENDSYISNLKFKLFNKISSNSPNHTWRESQMKYKKSIKKNKINNRSSSTDIIEDPLLIQEKCNKTVINKTEVDSQSNPSKNLHNLGSTQEQHMKAAKQNFEANIKIFQNFYHKQTNYFQIKQNEDKLNKPEEIIERIILYKKSHIIDNFKTYLIEISIAYRKLFILVYDIQNPKHILRLIYNEARYLQILNDYHYNFNELASKICISPNGIIHLKKSKPLKNQHQNKITAIEKQSEFLKRNFYDKIQKKLLLPPLAVNVVIDTHSKPDNSEYYTNNLKKTTEQRKRLARSLQNRFPKQLKQKSDRSKNQQKIQITSNQLNSTSSAHYRNCPKQKIKSQAQHQQQQDQQEHLQMNFQRHKTEMVQSYSQHKQF